ncbi:TPA: hypothetical protein DIC38_01285 [Candidatus Nomurabacteria bacterium]|nr:hypothetical protein [Candidatus Nomurabacteria bacterium]
MKNNKKKNYCPDCGGAQVNHKAMYLSLLLGEIMEPWVNLSSKILPEKYLENIGLILIKILTFLKIGKLDDTPKEKETGRTKVLFEEAKRRGIDMREFRLFGMGGDLFITKYKGKKRFFDVMPRPKDYNPKGLEWMDNKNEMKKHFKKENIPVANGDIVKNKKKALKVFKTLNNPVIVKPNLGSRSRHTTIHIKNENDLIEAYKKAKMLSPWVMIEEELEGYVFRGTLIGKKFIACLRREPAYVIGDGVHNVKELIEIENKNPLRQGPIFHTITLNDEVTKELIHWGKNLETIPNKDELILLGQKTSRAVGGGITDMTDVIHPDNIIMLEKIAEVLDDPLIGVDFIMKDVSKSWKEEPRCGVIECNSAPFIDLHHYPLIGNPRNVAGKLWDIIYPESKIN